MSTPGGWSARCGWNGPRSRCCTTGSTPDCRAGTPPAVAGGVRGIGLVALVGVPGRAEPPDVEEVATSRLGQDVVVSTTIAPDLVVLGRRTAALLAGA